jgi:predicted dehydrogenase
MEKMDVIHVCTPNISHCEITCAALEAGKHVLCEKPMAINSEQAKKMVDTAKKTGKKLTIGYQNRFRTDSQFLKESIQEDVLGDIYYGRAHALRRRGVPTWGVFTDKAKQGGGPLIDIGTHALDLTLWYMNNYEVHSVSGNCFYKLGGREEATYGNNGGPWNYKIYDVEDSAIGFVRMKNGAVIALEVSWALNTLDEGEAICSLSGVKGGAEMREGKGSGNRFSCRLNTTMGKQLIEISPSAQTGVAFSGGQPLTDDQYAGMCEAQSWVDAILNDTDPLVLPEQALVVTKILEAVYQSATTGKEVLID